MKMQLMLGGYQNISNLDTSQFRPRVLRLADEYGLAMQETYALQFLYIKQLCPNLPACADFAALPDILKMCDMSSHHLMTFVDDSRKHVKVLCFSFIASSRIDQLHVPDQPLVALWYASF